MSLGGFWKFSPLILMAIVVAGGILLFWRYDFIFTEAEAPAGEQLKAHFYKNPQIDISKVGLKVFYVLPSNLGNSPDPAWRDIVNSAFEKVAAFHRLQFRGLSEVSYDIFPRPVVLENPEDFYNTTSTDFGNPNALISIGEELDRRAFKESGDLYDEEFSGFETGEYPVMGFIYEGVGASAGIVEETEGEETKAEIAKLLNVPESIVFITKVESADGFLLLARQILKNKDGFNISGPTTLYHEFAHTIGFPDRYNVSEAGPSNDIMGGGILDPIEVTYIDRDFLKEVGVISK